MGSYTIPLLVGSGMNVENAGELWQEADGAIIGSGFKAGKELGAPIDRSLVKQFMEKIRAV